ncbi:SusD/RagB family nutrient-binding outer membrane lipoprotein [Sphingobacterium sp. lm-10]|uniref:SusD/RagB family nutrient-binding outer membrane lipoprotein n=1 Tax=Sphingobacterium sp. lm-10 TaxID=2944904 RepID=UPI00201FF73A|nr:SusD/RagB family nutrient-binding outer membrane lipoprotein [Sphingobacterium sp. lm-10]MCL7989485.1 SusD/RagB family nutrient-binding outer membrane lipoprotein [Sphingobacterium sp. lm-10]
MKLYIIKIGLLIVASFSLISCKDFLEVNDNPNAPTNDNLSLSVKLSAALNSSANYEATQLNQIGGFWGGYWGTAGEAASSFSTLKNYNGPGIRDTRDGIPVWETTYTNLFYYKQILEQADLEASLFYEGIAKVMTAYHYFILVDFYNNVPFEQALQGSLYLQPVYEPGRDVYQKSMDLITEGIAEIKSASNAPGADDVLFRGDRTKWAQFGNTLKLRALLRQSQVSDQSGYITQEVAKIVQEGSGFLLDNAMVNPGYLNTAGRMNPFFETYYRNNAGVAVANYGNIRPTRYLLAKYAEYNDPRLGQNFVTVNNAYQGVVFGDNTVSPEFASANTSAMKGPVENGATPAGVLKSFNQGSMVISSAEAYFLQAEAAERGWISANSTTLYNSAIQSSFNYQFNVNNYNIATYIAQPSVNIDVAPNKIERIITQKWLALSGLNNIQAWHDHKRLGIPAFPASVTSPTPGAYPRRFMYPETELNSNNQNASSQGDVGVLTGRVWWDVR